MVGNVTSLTNNGLKDWLIQRVSAVVLAAYVITLSVYCLMHTHMSYVEWRGLFESTLIRIFTVLALLSLGLHAWIGMWTITTDYLKCAVVRTMANVFIIVALLGYFIWGNIIVWGF